jgi:hypothetical protein
MGAALAGLAREAPAGNGAARRHSRASPFEDDPALGPTRSVVEGKIVLSLVLEKECLKENSEMVKLVEIPRIKEFACLGVKFRQVRELKVIWREAYEDRVKFRNCSPPRDMTRGLDVLSDISLLVFHS